MLLEDLDGVPARAALSAAGIYRLDELADAHPDALLALDGFGPGALLRTRDLLLNRGLLTDEIKTAADEVEAKAAAAAERKAARWALTHPFRLDAAAGFLCVEAGPGGDGYCHRLSADHDKPAPKPRTRKTPPAGAVA